jgi:hypothetical protein
MKGDLIKLMIGKQSILVKGGAWMIGRETTSIVGKISIQDKIIVKGKTFVEILITKSEGTKSRQT